MNSEEHASFNAAEISTEEKGCFNFMGGFAKTKNSDYSYGMVILLFYFPEKSIFFSRVKNWP